MTTMNRSLRLLPLLVLGLIAIPGRGETPSPPKIASAIRTAKKSAAKPESVATR